MGWSSFWLQSLLPSCTHLQRVERCIDEGGDMVQVSVRGRNVEEEQVGQSQQRKQHHRRANSFSTKRKADRQLILLTPTPFIIEWHCILLHATTIHCWFVISRACRDLSKVHTILFFICPAVLRQYNESKLSLSISCLKEEMFHSPI